MAYNIYVVSGTRAEYGLLRPVMEKINKNSSLTLYLVVTGSHLSQEHGYTVEEIEKDGFIPHAKIDILSGFNKENDSRQLTAMRTTKAFAEFTNYFIECTPKPDMVLVLGDRYEILAAGQAAAMLNIPLAHISGGDVTQGADDDWFRHCLTKMAKLHFPSCEEYRRRLLCMGEQPATVHNVGGLGDENVRNMCLLQKNELAQSLNISLDKKYALVTFHPETQGALSANKQAEIFIEAMSCNKDIFYIITMANADAGGFLLNEKLKEFCGNNKNAVLFSSLGVLRYLSAMKYASLVLGNSSSGIAETPSFGVPCVNIGIRQQGRMRSDNIIDCAMEVNEISKAINKAISDDFKNIANDVKSPYNGGDTSGKIVNIMLDALKNDTLKKPKEFYDFICM